MTVLAAAPLEEARFGVPTGRAEVRAASDVAAALAEARRMRLVLLILRCEAADMPAIHALERAGGHLMDTVVTYGRPFGHRETAPATPTDAVIRVARPDDTDALAALARGAFAGYTGHYHADPRLRASDCDEVYASWAARSVLEPGVADMVLVAEHHGRPVGFSTARLDGDTAVGDLDAVDPDHRGRGVYHSLGSARISWALAQRARRIRVDTHVTNFAAQRGLSRLGLLPERARHTFHLWND